MSRSWLTDIAFAHRGLHGSKTGHVENSLSAFQAANDQGHGFELDILLSHDNKAMVFHDVSLKRLTGQFGQLQDFTAEQLSKITLTGSGDKIPSLNNILLKTSPKYPVLIEIKGDQGTPDQIAEAVFNEIRNDDRPLAIMSFYPDIILWFQQNAPHILRGLVATSHNDGGFPDDYFSVATQKSLIDRLDVDFVAYDIATLPNEVTEYCQHKDVPILTWTVRTETQRRKAARYTDNIIYEDPG